MPLTVIAAGYKYRDFFYVKRDTSPTCTDEMPCPAVSITIIADGLFKVIYPEKPGDEAPFLEHFAAAGLNRDDVIFLCRSFLNMIKMNFGLDFTGIADDQCLLGNATIPGVAVYRAYHRTEASRVRVTTVTRGDEVQYLNVPASDVGWVLEFFADYVSQGTVKETIPKDAYRGFNSVVFRPCEGKTYGSCKNILELDTVFITGISKFPQMRQQPGDFRVVNFSSFNEKFGHGTRTGVCFRSEGMMNYRSVLIFP